MDFVVSKHRVMRSPDGVSPPEEFPPDVPFRPRDEAELKTLRDAGVLYEPPETDPNLNKTLPDNPQPVEEGTAADGAGNVPVEQRPPVQID